MRVEDIVIGTSIANKRCVFIMAFLNKDGEKCRYFISVGDREYFLHESSPSGILFYAKKKSPKMKDLILCIFERIKPIVKLSHGIKTD